MRNTKVSFSRAQTTMGLENKASVRYTPPFSTAVGSKMKIDAPNKLIVPIRNKQVSKIKIRKKEQKLCDQFHEDADIASTKLLLSYTGEKTDRDLVYIRNLSGHTKGQQNKEFQGTLNFVFISHSG